MNKGLLRSLVLASVLLDGVDDVGEFFFVGVTQRGEHFVGFE
jgi:hypothetical protein